MINPLVEIVTHHLFILNLHLFAFNNNINFLVKYFPTCLVGVYFCDHYLEYLLKFVVADKVTKEK